MKWKTNADVERDVVAALSQSNMNIKEILGTVGEEINDMNHNLMKRAIDKLRRRGAIERIAVGPGYWATYRLIGDMK
jgi:hypothetical protein